MAVLASQPSSIGWRFWVYWMLGTIAGAAVFLIASVPLNSIVAFAFGQADAGGIPAPIETPLLVALVGLSMGLLGALFGLGQWLALRRYLPGTVWWILATLVGYGIPLASTTLYGSRPSNWGPVLMGLEFGILLGVLQWLVLRQRVYQAGWWIPITFAGWILAFGLTGVAYLSGTYVEPMDMLFAFLVPVAASGAGMVWLLRRSARRGPPGALTSSSQS